MASEALHDFLYVVVFLIVGGVLAIGLILVGWLIGGRSTGEKRSETYESGVPTIGSAWVQFSISYYLFALIFLAFDVDVLYIFPLALVYGQGFGVRDFIEMAIFIGILSLAIVYAWRKGVFNWQKKD